MQATSQTHRVWWKEPMVWMIAGLPLSAVVAGIVTIWIAVNNADTLVNEGYRKDGLAFNLDNAREDIAAQLGMAARVVAGPDGLSVHLTGNFGTPPATISLTLLHPTDAKGDVTLALSKGEAALYNAPLPDVTSLSLTSDQTRVIIEPDNQAWRLRGEWATPFIGTLDVKPADTTHSSTPQ